MVTRVILGFVPLMVIWNVPMYPIIKLGAYSYSVFQTIFLSAKDKSNLAFLTGLKSCISYGAYTLGIMAVRADVFSLTTVTVYSLVANIVGGLEVVMLSGKEYKGLLVSKDSETKKVKLDAPWGVKIVTVRN